MIEYNAVCCCHIPRQDDTPPFALPQAGHFAYWEGTTFMAVSHKTRWKLLIDKDIKKKDLCTKVGISDHDW